MLPVCCRPCSGWIHADEPAPAMKHPPRRGSQARPRASRPQAAVLILRWQSLDGDRSTIKGCHSQVQGAPGTARAELHAAARTTASPSDGLVTLEVVTLETQL